LKAIHKPGPVLRCKRDCAAERGGAFSFAEFRDDTLFIYDGLAVANTMANSP
jgi:hypothetical protein